MKKGITIRCLICSKDIYVMPCFIGKTKYCSRKCQHKGLENHLILQCKNCGVDYRTYLSHRIHRGSNFCSRKCMGEFKGKSQIGENNPYWKGGISSVNKLLRSGKQWKFWRKAVFERDKYTCRNCGKLGSCLEPHHIKPFAFFPEKRFDVENGLTLCKSCHNKTKISAKEMRKLYETVTT